MNKEHIITTTKLLNDFRSTISNRSLSNLFFSDFFINLLDWHFFVWEKELNYLNEGEEMIDMWSKYYQLFLTISLILDDVTTRILAENSMDAYYFFDKFSKHIDTHKDEVRTVRKCDKESKHLYIDQILSHFFRIFFEKITDSPNRFDIFENYFPKHWLVTHANLQNGDSINRIVLNRFMDFAVNRIGTAKKNDFDKQLNEVNEELFPEVDPVRWAKILIFVLSPYDPNHRVDSVVRRSWTFGITGRIRAFSGYHEDDKKFQEDFTKYLRNTDGVEKIATYKLAIFLFKDQFTESNLSLYIIEANNLNYEPGTEEEKNRNHLVRIFTEMRETIKQV